MGKKDKAIDPFEDIDAELRSDPSSPSVEPVAVVTIETLDIGPTDPYPTGDPQVPVTYAEINGLVPPGTGPLAPVPPDPPIVE